MDTPFYHDSMSGAFTPHHHHPLPHRFHGDYGRYLSNNGNAGKASVAAPKKAIAASSYFSDPVAAAGLGTAAAAGGAKPNSFQGLPLPPAPSAANNVGQSLASPAPSSSAASGADLMLVQATNHHGLAMTGHTPMLPVGGGSGHTPNSNHPGGHLLYRASQQATNEQEGFVDGFVKALADLHKQNQLSGGSGSGGGGGAPGTGGGGSGVAGTGPGGAGGGADAPIYTNLSSYGAQNHMGYHQVGYQGSAGGPGGREAAGPLQVVPHAPPLPTLPLHNSSSSPTLSPVDLETQDRIKSERKKLRNRIAASKCRKRKLERIARLEDKVSLLKSFNGDLASTAAILKQEVEHLREKVRIHMTRGCQIIITGGGGGRRGEEAIEKEENTSWGKKSKY